MDWQLIAVVGVVGIATALLLRRAAHWVNGIGESPCGGCANSSPQLKTDKIITEDEISLPK